MDSFAAVLDATDGSALALADPRAGPRQTFADIFLKTGARGPVPQACRIAAADVDGALEHAAAASATRPTERP
jgi:hypothetical protein